jgi:hypothetical protein
MAHTFVRCQGGSSPEDDCRNVAYASHGPAVTSVAGTSIKLEPSDEAAPELPERAEGIGSAGLADGYLVHEGVGGGAAAPKRGAASAGGGSSIQKRAKCEHERQKSTNKECGGSEICSHGRIKSQCKECGGKNICSHGRRKSDCKECGGSAICPHGRRKSDCKECGGSGICPHGRIKRTCKDCGGSGICSHGRQKSQCKECGGSAICAHGRRKSTCKECGGSAICPHGRQKRQCKECGGKNICSHGRQKRQCKECGGKNICPHGRQKSRCKECGGSGICAHGRTKYSCKDCLTTRSTSEAQSSRAPCAASCDTAEGGGTRGRDALLDELRAWVGGLERIGDAAQLTALLVQSEVSLANLGSFSVDELAAIGINAAAASELLSQFSCRGMGQ